MWPAEYPPLRGGLPHTACPPLGWSCLNKSVRSRESELRTERGLSREGKRAKDGLGEGYILTRMCKEVL